MISAFQYYFPNVLDNINQKHLEQKNPSIYQPRYLKPIQETPIQETPIQETPKTVEVELMIEDKFIGKIIGRGGFNIDQLRKNTNTKIVIYRKLYDTPNADLVETEARLRSRYRVSGQGTKRRVVISGDIDCVENAKNKISEIVDSSDLRSK